MRAWSSCFSRALDEDRPLIVDGRANVSEDRRGSAHDAPGSNRFSGRAIQREILTEALQHPTTLYAFAAGAVAASYTAFVGPFLGGQGWGVIIAVAFCALAAGSFGWRYFVRGADEARTRARRLIAAEEQRQKQSAEREFEARKRVLDARLATLRWEEGIRVLADLAGEYDQLLSAAENYSTDDPLVIARVRAPATQDYRDGFHALEEAVDILQTIEETDHQRIEGEVLELESELTALERTGADPARATLLRQTIAAERTTLELLTQQSGRVKDLVHEAQLAEAALRRARVGLPSMAADAVSAPTGEMGGSAGDPGIMGVPRRGASREADLADHERIRD